MRICTSTPQHTRERHISKLLRISQDLLVAALGSNPAIKALKIKYDMAQHDIVLQVKRIRQQVIKPCVLKVENATFALEFDESNYNLGVYLRRTSTAEAPFDIKLSLLHPYDTAFATDFIFSQALTSSTTPGKAKGFHVIKSHDLDNYCVNGYFFVKISGDTGAVVQD